MKVFFSRFRRPILGWNDGCNEDVLLRSWPSPSKERNGQWPIHSITEIFCSRMSLKSILWCWWAISIWQEQSFRTTRRPPGRVTRFLNSKMEIDSLNLVIVNPASISPLGLHSLKKVSTIGKLRLKICCFWKIWLTIWRSLPSILWTNVRMSSAANLGA